MALKVNKYFTFKINFNKILSQKKKIALKKMPSLEAMASLYAVLKFNKYHQLKPSGQFAFSPYWFLTIAPELFRLTGI